MAKTCIQVKYAPSIWPIVEKWAVENKYLLEKPGEFTRLYLRTSKEASAKISIEISQIDDDVKIIAWFSDLIRKELEIDSPSLYSALPRKKALSEIQDLLSGLGTIPHRKPKKKQNMAFNFGRSIRKLSGKK